MGACQSASTAVDTFAAPPIDKNKVAVTLAELNATHAELKKVLANASAVNAAFDAWHHDIQLREFARSRGTNMTLFDERLRARRACEAEVRRAENQAKIDSI